MLRDFALLLSSLALFSISSCAPCLYGGGTFESKSSREKCEKSKAAPTSSKASGPTSNLHCAKSNDCKQWGKCALVGKTCKATAHVHCAKSKLCRSQGKCTFHPSKGCIATSEGDCKRSSDCRIKGKCTLKRSSSLGKSYCTK